MAVEQLGYESALSSRLEIFRSDVARTLGLLCFAAIVLAATLWEKLAMHWANDCPNGSYGPGSMEC